MPYRVNCPNCKTACSIADESLGKQLLCPTCRKPFTAGKPKEPAPVAPKPTLPSAPKATAGHTTTDLPARPKAALPPRSDAVPPLRGKKSPLLLGCVFGGALLVLVGAVGAAIVAGIYFLKAPTEAPIAQRGSQSASPHKASEQNPASPSDSKQTKPPDASQPAVDPDKPTRPPTSPPSTPAPTTPAPVPVRADPTRIKIPNARLAKYEPDKKRWVYSFRNAVRATNGMFTIDLLPPSAPTDREAYAAKLLEKDFQDPGQQFTEITDKGDLPDGFFLKGVVKDQARPKPEFASVLVRKVNGAFLRCRSGTVANRPVTDDELYQSMTDLFKQVTIRTTTLLSLPPPSGAVLLPDNVTLVVAHAETANLIYFDTMAEREVKRVEVDFQPGELAVQGDTIFAAAKGSALVYALNAATGKVKKEYNLGGEGIVHLACHPKKGLIYASTTKFGVVSLDPSSGTVHTPKAVGQFLAVSPGGKFLYTGVQPPNLDEIEVITRKDGSVRIYWDMWGPRAMLMKYTVDGPNLRFQSGQNNAAVNGWWMHLTPDGKRLMMVGGGGWRPPKEGGTGGGYVTAIFSTTDLNTKLQTIPFSGLSTIFHPVLNLGVTNHHGHGVTVFNGKSLVKRTEINLSTERESRPLLLLFGGKGRKLILWNGDNIQKEQGLHFLPLPLKPEEEAALAKADEQPAAQEPEEPATPSPSAKADAPKMNEAKTPEEIEAAVKKLGGSVEHQGFDMKKPIVEVTFLGKKVADDDLAVLSSLTSLKKLTLLQSGMTDKGLEHLAGLVNLEELNLVGDPITDAGLERLKGLKSLHTLKVTGNDLTDDGIAHLKGLAALKSLDLVGSVKITDKGMAHLAVLKDLETLKLAGTQITGSGLVHLKELSKLRDLDISHNDIRNEELAHLKELKGVTKLNLSGNLRITDAGLDALKELSNLTEVRLIVTHVTDKGVAELKRALPKAEIMR